MHPSDRKRVIIKLTKLILRNRHELAVMESLESGKPVSECQLTDVPETELKNSEWIELFGPNILLDDAARAAGTIGYEFLTGLGTRYVREYLR